MKHSHLAVARAADADAALPRVVRRVHRARLGVRAVEHVVPVDEDSAQAAELIPGVERLERASGRGSGCGCSSDRRRTAGPSNRTRARAADRTRLRGPGRACRTPSGTCRSCRTSTSRACGAAVAFGHEDVAVRVGDDVVRLVERRRIGRLAGLVAARLAERQQQLAFGAELVDLMADDLRRWRRAAARPRAGRDDDAAGCPGRRSPTRCPGDRRECRAGRRTCRRRSCRAACRSPDRT